MIRLNSYILRLAAFLFLVISGGCWLTPLHAQSSIRLRVRGIADTTVMLGYYMGEGRYAADTIRVDSKGQGGFISDSARVQGMYIIILPDYRMFDFLLGEEQNLSIEFEANDPIASAKIEGADIAQELLTYQRFMVDMRRRGERIPHLDSMAKVHNPANPDQTQEYKDARRLAGELQQEVSAYQERLMVKHERNVLGKFVRSSVPVEIPPYTPPVEIVNQDSAKWAYSYHYNTQHYLDNIDLGYYPLIRTPVALPKIDNYFDRVLLQIPDTLNYHIDRILERTTPETFRYYVTHLFNKYQKSEIIGMDAVVVHMAEKYYLSGKTPWIDEETKGKIYQHIQLIKPNILGKVAPDFTAERLDGGSFQLSKSKAPVTVIVFWEPSCSHCKVALPKIDSVTRSYEPKGLKVIAFMTQGDGPAWQTYVMEHKLQRWVNVWDPYRKTKFQDNYNIYSTPVIYVLDREQKIFIKRIGADQLDNVLKDLFRLQDKEAKGRS